jgi:predicted Kef-type K+ transport protein
MDEKEQRGMRLEYLRDVYGIYSGHINSMFNFYLLVAALIAGAYVQTFDPDFALPRYVSLSVGTLGLLLSLIFLGVHFRSRTILDTVETALRVEEAVLFPTGRGFLISVPESPLGLKFLFPAAYGVFIVAFICMAIFPTTLGSSLPVPLTDG